MAGFLGLAFDDLTIQQAADLVWDRGISAEFGYVVTPNADHLVRVGRDQRLRTIYERSALCLLDSRVVAGLARLIGLHPPTVVPGSDLTALLLARCANQPVTIIGLSQAWMPALVARYRLSAAAHHDPPMGFDQDAEAFAAAVRFVRDHPARLVFLAVGSPRQELLAAAIAAQGDATGTGLCVGASLEFLAGARRRAPRWVCHAGFEWLFRLLANPRRMVRRYMWDSPGVITLLVKQRLLKPPAA